MIDEPLSLRVLIADDESIARDILQFYLETFGCQVIAATDGDEALAIFRDCAQNIDLAILDICMPGPRPGELYALLRQHNPSGAILYCSGVAPHDDLLHEIAATHAHLLSKPFNRSDLRLALLEITKKSTGRGRLGLAEHQSAVYR